MLNDTLENSVMKTVHMMSFCSTRIPYILLAYKQTETIVHLVALCNVIATTNLKLKESTPLFPKNMIILHPLADRESIFSNILLNC